MSLFQFLMALLTAGLMSFCGQVDLEKKPIANNSDIGDSVQNSKTFNTDSFLRSIVSELELKSGLPRLSSGFDSIQIRIWRHSTMSANRKLIMFWNTDNQWHSGIFNLRFVFTGNVREFSIKKMPIGLTTPKSGWPTFKNFLLTSDIAILPDISTLQGYVPSTDSDYIIVEIAKRDSYRIYSYTDINAYKERMDEVKKFSQILDNIKHEFEIPDEL